MGTNSGKARTKEIMTRYPLEDGIIAGTTTQVGHVQSLEPQQSFVRKEYRKLL